MSDSETDDTTPLLNPVENSNHGTFSIGQRNIQGDNANERPTSDDENRKLMLKKLPLRNEFGQKSLPASSNREVLYFNSIISVLADSSNQSSTGRVNPFNRVPNLPPNLLDELTGRQSIWSRLSRYISRLDPNKPIYFQYPTMEF